MMDKTQWQAIAVIAGIWIVVLTLAIVPYLFDNWCILSGGFL